AGAAGRAGCAAAPRGVGCPPRPGRARRRQTPTRGSAISHAQVGARRFFCGRSSNMMLAYLVLVEKPMDAALSTRPTLTSILVVEDFRLLRLSVVEWLKCRFPGCAVHGVETGEEALKHALAFRTDVVLL